MHTTAKSLRRILVFTTGSIILIAGIILLVVPGPGLLLILLGLLVLSVDFPWAQKYIDKIKRRIKR